MTDTPTLLSNFIGIVRLSMQHLHASEIAWLALPAVLAACAPRAPWRHYALLLLLPAIWIALELLGAAFFSGKPHDIPLWLSLPFDLAVPLYWALTIVLVWRLPDLRVVTVAMAAVNLTFFHRAAFVAGMAVSGSWL